MHSSQELDYGVCGIHNEQILKVCLESCGKLCKTCIDQHNHPEIGTFQLYKEFTKKFKDERIQVSHERFGDALCQLQSLEKEMGNILNSIQTKMQKLIEESLNIEQINKKYEILQKINEQNYMENIEIMKEFYLNQSMFFDEQLRVGNLEESLLQKMNKIVHLIRSQMDYIQLNTEQLMTSKRKISQKYIDFQLLQNLDVHDNVVKGCIILPNMDLATGSRDKTIKIWSSFNYTCIQVLKDHYNWVQQLINLPNSQFASCSDDKTIKLFKQQQNQWVCFKTLHGHESYVRNIAYSTLYQSLLSCSTDGTLRIWKDDTSHILHGHNNCIYTIASADDYLVSGDEGGDILLWSIIDRKLLHHQEHGHSGCVNCLLIKENIYSCGDDRKMICWNTELRVLFQIDFKRGELERLAFVNDHLLLGGDEEGYLHLISLDEQQVLCEMVAHSDRIYNIGIHNQEIYTVSADHSLRIFKLQLL